jgi:hypothetical protein
MPMSLAHDHPRCRPGCNGWDGKAVKKQHLALVPVLYRDPECLLHNDGVFEVLFPEGRPLDDLDFNDLEDLCSCKHEAHEPGARRKKERKPKFCPTCRTARARNGTCFCD